MEESVAQQLNLDGTAIPLTLTWTQNIQTKSPSDSVNLWISGSSGKEHAIQGVRTIADLQLPSQSLNIKELKRRFSYLQDVPDDSDRTGALAPDVANGTTRRR